jgi:DNA primase
MAIFNKESLETLRQRIDLFEVLSVYIDFKRSGSTYTALCPFHDEKTPSFTIHKGDSYYHCFGCGAHGDAIAFLMNHQRMSFGEAIESLAQRFQVHLEKVEEGESKGPSKALLKEALSLACQFYHFFLLHTDEGHQALQYLYNRGIDLNFIHYFHIGWAPKEPRIFQRIMRAKGVQESILLEAGLIAKNSQGSSRDFFSDRIMFPVYHHAQGVIGFSGRKYQESTFGGKYINSPETVLFKKSRILFGLSYCRRRIAKERKVIIVEGQIDALRLIQEGFNITVASQGTAFGELHAKELLSLGVNQVFLAMDSDKAGREATSKIGHFFQREGVEVYVINLPPSYDPDLFLREKGADEFLKLIETSSDFLTFLIQFHGEPLNMASAAGKSELIQIITKQIRLWNHPVMVHESLKKLAHTLQIPEDLIGMGADYTPHTFMKKVIGDGFQSIDPNKILEGDLLRWLLLIGQEQPNLSALVGAYIQLDDFRNPICRQVFDVYQKNSENKKMTDLISLIIEIGEEGQTFINELLQKKVNRERAEQQLIETLQKMLDRNWIQKREAIKMKIQSGNCSDEEALELLKQFDDIKRVVPKL